MISGPWSGASKIRSVDNLLRDIRKRPEDLRKLLGFSMNVVLDFVNIFENEVGSDTVQIMDPVTTCDFLSPKQFDIFSYQYLEELINKIKTITGKKPGLHICGHTEPIWDRIKKLDVRFFSIDNSEDIEKAKKYCEISL